MTGMLNSMKKKKNEIPEETLPLFENILQTYKGDEREREFYKAMEKNLTREQRFRLFAQNGGCNGAGQDKQRAAFAREHAGKPLGERLKLFADAHNRNIVLNGDNTITVTFSCNHGYYKHAPKGNFAFQETVETYFERCAGGRMYELQKVLGVALRIKSVDVSPLKENVSNPVVFTYEIA